MSNRRTTPIEIPHIETHQCSLDVRLEKLSMVPFFRHLSRQALKTVNSSFSVHHFEKDDDIYQQGKCAVYLRILVFGAVRLIHHTEEGKDLLLDLLQPGEYFGTLPLLGDGQYQEAAYAHTDCCVMTTDEPAFMSILHTHPDVAVKLIGINARRLSRARNTIRDLTTTNVERRIVSVLLSLADKFGKIQEKDILIDLPLSRKDLADMTGTSTETVSRIMSRFQQDGYITSGRKWIAVRNREGFTAFLDGE